MGENDVLEVVLGLGPFHGGVRVKVWTRGTPKQMQISSPPSRYLHPHHHWEAFAAHRASHPQQDKASPILSEALCGKYTSCHHGPGPGMSRLWVTQLKCPDHPLRCCSSA